MFAPWIKQLPDIYRRVICLSDMNESTQTDAAMIQSVFLLGAKSRIYRGRDRLKTILLDCCEFDFDQCGNPLGSSQSNGPCDICY